MIDYEMGMFHNLNGSFCVHEVTKYFIRKLIYFIEQTHLTRWKSSIRSHTRGPRILPASPVSFVFVSLKLLIKLTLNQISTSWSISFDKLILGVVADGSSPGKKHWWLMSSNSNKGDENFQIMNILGSIPLMEWL